MKISDSDSNSNNNKKNITATPKHDSNADYLGLTSAGKEFPPKVIRVTKTIAVQVPVPVPVKPHDSHYHSSSESHKVVTPPILPIKRSTTKSSKSSFDLDNSIWQQNFPPFTSSPVKRKKFRTTTEAAPTAGVINISQDPNSKAVNIRIPWNAAMKETFMDDISKNPQPLLNSLNLLPALDSSSYAAPASGHNFDATILTSQKELQDFSHFYNHPGMDDPLPEFHSNPSPQYTSYHEHHQFHGDEHSNVSTYVRYPSTKKSPSTTTFHKFNEVEYKQEEHRRPRKPSLPSHKPPIDLDSFHSGSGTHTFLGAFTPDETTFAHSDMQGKLREYEKRVEKEVNDGGLHVLGGNSADTQPRSTTKRPKAPRHPRHGSPKKPKKIHTITLIKKN